MEKFTIIAKPYLLSDLRQACLAVSKAFADHFDYDEKAAELLKQIWVAADTNSLKPTLRSTVAQLNETLGYSYIAKEEQRDLLRLAKLIDALLEWPEQTGGTLLWNQSKHLEAIESDAAFKVQIKHPKPEVYSVELRLNPDLKGSCWIASESYWQSFRSNPPENNALYLNADYKSYEFVEFIYANQYRAYYRKLAYDAEPIKLPETMFSTQSEQLGAFFQEITTQDFAAKGNSKTVVFYLAALSDRKAYESYPSIGWLNPLILTFDLNANDIPDAAAESRAEQALALFSSEDLLIHFEPHLSALEVARQSLFMALMREQNQRRSYRSIVERLFWGPDGQEAWQTFFYLDQLDGVFSVEGFGYYGFKAHEEPVIYWQAPEGLSKNQCWLKHYLLQLSSHIQEKSLAAVPSLSASAMPGFGSPQGHTKVKLEPQLKPTVFDILKALRSTKTSVLSQEGQVELDLLGQMLDYGLEFLERLKISYPESNLYFGEGSFQVMADGTVRFNDLAFLETFAKHYLSPRSSIIVHLSPIEEEDATLDFIASLPYAHKKLFESLLLSQRTVLADKYVEIIYDYGWWQDWFELLFKQRWDVRINYISNRGFIVRRSLLGQVQLGKARVGNQYNVNEMRI